MRNFQSVVLSCFLTLAVLGRDCLAHLYDNDAHVKVIDKYSTFENEILKSESVWMIQFFSPTSPNSKQAKPKYSQIASIMRSIAYVAVVDMSTEAGERIGATLKVDSYPTYYMYGDDKNNPVEYTGERDLQGILQGLMNCVALTVQSRARDSSATKSKIREELPEKRKELPELTNTTILEEECGGKNRICVLAALPHILDSGADGRNKYKALVFNVSKSFPFSTYRFMWFEGGSQPDLEDALELTFGFPALVALSLDEEAYAAVMRGSFNEKTATAFLHGVTSGRQPTTILSKIPKVVTVEPWDGEDATPIEDEMSLSEIMGWDDEDDAGEKRKSGDDAEEKEGEDEL